MTKKFKKSTEELINIFLLHLFLKNILNFLSNKDWKDLLPMYMVLYSVHA